MLTKQLQFNAELSSLKKWKKINNGNKIHKDRCS